jgi:hypothetical protein
MGGRDEIDIMAANLLKVKHHIRDVFILNFLSSSLMGNGPVLTEDTTEVAIREKDGTRPSSTYQTHLLTKMGMIAKNHRLNRSPTEPLFTLLPIHPTTPGTELATFKDGIGLFDLLGQFALLLQFLISWGPAFFLFLSCMKGKRGKE